MANIKCPRCAKIFPRPAGAIVCPNCGFKAPSSAGSAPRGRASAASPAPTMRASPVPRMPPQPGAPAGTGRVVNVTPTMIGCFILAGGFALNAGLAFTVDSNSNGIDVAAGLILLVGFIVVRVGARSLWPAQRLLSILGAVAMLGAIILNGTIKNTHATDAASIKNVLLLGILHDALVGVAAVLTLWLLGRIIERVLTIVALVGGVVCGFILYGMVDGLTVSSLDTFLNVARADVIVGTLPVAVAALLCGLQLKKRVGGAPNP